MDNLENDPLLNPESHPPAESNLETKNIDEILGESSVKGSSPMSPSLMLMAVLALQVITLFYTGYAVHSQTKTIDDLSEKVSELTKGLSQLSQETSAALIGIRSLQSSPSQQFKKKESAPTAAKPATKHHKKKHSH